MYYPEQLQGNITPHNARQLYYFSTDRANYWVDISSIVDKKVAALRCHESQTKQKDNHTWVREKGLVAGIDHKLKYAEAFHHHVM